ncbi:hypothetical protein ES702_01856 [subsurface metagenome]
MDYTPWAMLIVWFFLLAVGHTWKKNIFTVAGGIIGLVLMVEVMADSFLFALALGIINVYIIYASLVEG